MKRPAQKLKIVPGMAAGCIAVFLLIQFTSCQNKSEESLFGPPVTCDTSHTNYSITIAAIISNNGCLACHSGPSPDAGFTLSSYSDLKTVASNGQLYGALFHLPGYTPMPQGGAQLSNCELNKVKAWINAGAPSN